jgi:hypothetical protein
MDNKNAKLIVAAANLLKNAHNHCNAVKYLKSKGLSDSDVLQALALAVK